MSRPSPSGPSIPRLLERLSSGNARDALHASEALAQLAATGPAEALRLAQCGAVPALVQAMCGPDGDVIANAGTALVAVAGAAPDLVADTASSALVAALGGANSTAARGAAWVFRAIAEHSPERVAAAPGALQALSSSLSGTAVNTIDSAARALLCCASGSPGLARRVADTPGSLAALVAMVASSNAGDGHNSAVSTLFEIAKADADLAVRVISTSGAPQALSQAALRCSDVSVAKCAAGVLAVAADAGREQATTIASPDVLAALVSAAGRAGMRVRCMATLAMITRASPPLAQRVAATPGADAAMLAALTCGDLLAARLAVLALDDIVQVDAERAARLLSAPEAPTALAGLLQSNDPEAVKTSTCVLAHMEECGVQLVARLPPLPGVVLEAWAAMLGDAEAVPSSAAALVLHGLVLAGADEARRVISTPGFTQAAASALGHSHSSTVTHTLAVLGAVATAGPDLAARVATIAELLPALLRAVQSSAIECTGNAAGVLYTVCRFDLVLAHKAAAAPGVLRALVAMLQRGPGDTAARNAACALASMAIGVDGLRLDLASRLAAEDGLLSALAAFAHRTSGLETSNAVRALAAIACSGGNLASLVGRTEGAIPALVRALRKANEARFAIPALEALRTIAAASPHNLGRRILDSGAADAAAALLARAQDGLAPPQAAVVAGPRLITDVRVYPAALLRALAALDAATVTAALAGLLAHCDTAASASARDLLAAEPLSLGPVAIEALARQAEAAAQARTQAAALEALAAASALEADAAGPRLCAACSQQLEAAGGGRLRPCAGCSGKGPAGRALYCGADCQRAHWPAHRAYCKQAAAAAADTK